MKDIAISILASIMQGMANFISMILAFVIVACFIGLCSWIGGLFRRRTS